jgi:hypothetical protein
VNTTADSAASAHIPPRRPARGAAAVGPFFAAEISMAGTWQPIANPPKFGASTMLLLTDGTIMCQESGGLNWWRLTPDNTGDYINGTWSPLAPMHQTRLYYGSAVLADGRVFVAGGEYSNAGSETNTAEIYDPVLDSWKVLPAPTGWAQIGDAITCVLSDGRLLMGQIEDPRTAFFDPNTDTWTDGPKKDDSSSEETWTLLPDGTVLTAECSNHPKAEKYVPRKNAWVSAGSTPVDLVEASSIEIGPALLLPNGHVFAVGATGHTALYMPPDDDPDDPGSWCAGPDFPSESGKPLGAKDAPGCLLPNGKVLCAAGPVDGVSGDYLRPTFFFEYDGESLTRIASPGNSTGVPYEGRMLLTPTGRVLFAADTAEIYVYAPDCEPCPDWRPCVRSCPRVLRPLHSYTLFGTQFNGRSQAVSYGDDAQMATNYPIVQVRNRASGTVKYCRTFDHSTMAVATGDDLVWTNFTVPLDIETGPVELRVIANGIASEPVEACVERSLHLNAFNDALVNSQITDLKAEAPLGFGPDGVVHLGPENAALTSQATDALTALFQAVATLQSVGRQAVGQRLAAAQAVPAAKDPELDKARAKSSGTAAS